MSQNPVEVQNVSQLSHTHQTILDHFALVAPITLCHGLQSLLPRAIQSLIFQPLK
jgi:hypothetical protein